MLFYFALSKTQQKSLFLLIWTILIFASFSLIIFNLQKAENGNQLENIKTLDVEILLNNKIDWCTEDLGQDLIVVISTQFVTRRDFELRQAVRDTWGKRTTHKKFLFQNVFFLGKGNGSNEEEDKELDEFLHIENRNYGDLVLGDFIDSYKNLTYKRLLSSKWIIENCPNAQFILKIDDEMYPDIFRIFDLIETHASKTIDSSFLAHLACHIYERNFPIRNSSDKMYVSIEEYPRNFFPDFCFGPASITTRSALIAEYSVKSFIPFFWAEDVFFTGFLREYYELVNNVPISMISIPYSHYYPPREHILLWCQSEVTSYILNSNNGGIFVQMVRGDEMISDLYCLHKKTLTVRQNFELYNKIKISQFKK